MKKLITFVLGLIFALTLAGCSSEQKNFEIVDAQKMVIISVDGKKVEVTDTNTIQQVTDNITSIVFEKDKSSKNTNGFGSIIQWYNSNGNLMEVISVMGEQTINYENYFWTAAEGSIDTEVLDQLLGS